MAYLQELFRTFRRFPTTVKFFYVADILLAFSMAIFSTLFNLHLLAVGYTADHVGQLQAVYSLSMAAVAIPVGLMGDRWDRRRLYVAGSLTFALPFMIIPWLREFPVIMAVYTVSGMAHTLMLVNESPLLAGEVPAEDRASVYSFMMINFFIWNTMATQLAGFLAEWLPAGAMTQYQWPLVIAGLFGLACGLARSMLRFRRQAPVTKPLNLRPSKTTVNLAVAATLTAAFAALTMSFSNVILASRYHYSPALISTMLTIAGTVGWLGSLLVPWTSGRFGNVRGVCSVAALQGVLLLLMGLAGSPAAFLPAFWGRAVLGNMQGALWMAMVMDVTAEDERATANAYNVCGRSIGSALAAKVYGALLSAGHFLLPFAVASLFAAATAAFIFFTFRKRSLTASPPVGA